MLLCCYTIHLVVLCFSTRAFFTICVVVAFVEKTSPELGPASFDMQI